MKYRNAKHGADKERSLVGTSLDNCLHIKLSNAIFKDELIGRRKDECLKTLAVEGGSDIALKACRRWVKFAVLVGKSDKPERNSDRDRIGEALQGKFNVVVGCLGQSRPERIIN